MSKNANQKSKMLKLILEIAREKHNNRRQEIEAQSKKAELLFLVVGFTFAGVTGLYQSNILNKFNVQQIVVLIIEFAVLILFVILSWLWKRREYDSPSIRGIISLYHKNKTIKNLQIELINSYKQAENFNRKKLRNIAIKMNWAFMMVLLLYVSVIVFILLPNFQFCIV